MKVAVIATALALAPTALGAKFFGLAIHSASPIHLQSVEARGQSVYVGGKTRSYCPDIVEQCPAGKDAVFAADRGYMSMNVMVPGGQQSYVDPDGWLKYTQAHSAFIPEGSSVKGFKYVPPAPSHPDYGYLKYKKHDWWACKTRGGWRVNARQRNDECIGFRWLAYPAKKVGAWQYT